MYSKRIDASCIVAKTSVPIHLPSIYPNVSSDVQRFSRHYQTALFFQEWYPDWSNLGMSCHAAGLSFDDFEFLDSASLFCFWLTTCLFWSLFLAFESYRFFEIFSFAFSTEFSALLFNCSALFLIC